MTLLFRQDRSTQDSYALPSPICPPGWNQSEEKVEERLILVEGMAVYSLSTAGVSSQSMLPVLIQAGKKYYYCLILGIHISLEFLSLWTLLLIMILTAELNWLSSLSLSSVVLTILTPQSQSVSQTRRCAVWLVWFVIMVWVAYLAARTDIRSRCHHYHASEPPDWKWWYIVLNFISVCNHINIVYNSFKV